MSSQPVDPAKPPDNKCKFCAKFCSLSEVKCTNSACDTLLHGKCFDSIAKIVPMKKEEFRCKHCLGDGKVSSSSTDVLLLHKEIDCLTREKQLLEKYVSELEFSNTILKSKTPAVSSTLNSAVGFFPNSSLVNTYSQAAKKVSPSAVLVIKPTDINMGNAKLEQELKSKFRPSQLNANVTGTRLIRDGVLVNCADVKSLQNLKDGLKRQAGNAFNILSWSSAFHMSLDFLVRLTKSI
ncbi:unnamed protein product [Acanthoscelides obtectus]|uniref:Uncharacterized protein n=1 Tax=Acanthoscelides obtectus TaxID=200917 RepID=A0A9P0LLZ2_ACAOB|nr:unnamed protein product [Acanthoscelides obtectus]CAK1653249.1 hypothetical protein AOBTE_LOCUS18154 [Acanthoscelides obtectus]